MSPHSSFPVQIPSLDYAPPDSVLLGYDMWVILPTMIIKEYMEIMDGLMGKKLLLLCGWIILGAGLDLVGVVL